VGKNQETLSSLDDGVDHVLDVENVVNRDDIEGGKIVNSVEVPPW
jgi:hypothetical protein